MHLRFTTANSVYEVDQANKRIRRTKGVVPPTPYQGDDNEWREYAELSPITIGKGVLVVWGLSDIGAVQTTYTSDVVSFETL